MVSRPDLGHAFSEALCPDCVFPCGQAPGRRLRAPAQPAPQPGGGLLERICPVEPFSIVPRSLAGGCAPRLPGGDVTESAFCATWEPQTAPLREASGRDASLCETVRASPRPWTRGHCDLWSRSSDTRVPASVDEGLMPHDAEDGRRAQAAAHGSPPPGAGPRAGNGSVLCPAD